MLGGKESSFIAPIVTDATGKTIVKAIFGERAGFGQVENSPILYKAVFYIGYGRTFTGAVWYKGMLRDELRYRF